MLICIGSTLRHNEAGTIIILSCYSMAVAFWLINIKMELL